MFSWLGQGPDKQVRQRSTTRRRDVEWDRRAMQDKNKKTETVTDKRLKQRQSRADHTGDGK